MKINPEIPNLFEIGLKISGIVLEDLKSFTVAGYIISP
jgi:hypothetical protein